MKADAENQNPAALASENLARFENLVRVDRKRDEQKSRLWLGLKALTRVICTALLHKPDKDLPVYLPRYFCPSTISSLSTAQRQHGFGTTAENDVVSHHRR